jgi:hypothetical protein
MTGRYGLELFAKHAFLLPKAAAYPRCNDVGITAGWRVFQHLPYCWVKALPRPGAT